MFFYWKASLTQNEIAIVPITQIAYPIFTDNTPTSLSQWYFWLLQNLTKIHPDYSDNSDYTKNTPNFILRTAITMSTQMPNQISSWSKC